MPIIKQYRPNFFEGFESKEQQYSTLKELLDIPFVKAFSIDDKFHQYSLSTNGNRSDTGNLMAEYEGGTKWWVVGIVDINDITSQLPKFEPKNTARVI